MKFFDEVEKVCFLRLRLLFLLLPPPALLFSPLSIVFAFCSLSFPPLFFSFCHLFLSAIVYISLTHFYTFCLELKLTGRTPMKPTLSQPRRLTSNVPRWSSLFMRSVSPGTLTPQRRRRRKRRRKKTRWVKEEVKCGGVGREINYMLVNCCPS